MDDTKVDFGASHACIHTSILYLFSLVSSLQLLSWWLIFIPPFSNSTTLEVTRLSIQAPASSWEPFNHSTFSHQGLEKQNTLQKLWQCAPHTVGQHELSLCTLVSLPPSHPVSYSEMCWGAEAVHKIHRTNFLWLEQPASQNGWPLLSLEKQLRGATLWTCSIGIHLASHSPLLRETKKTRNETKPD